MCNLKPEARLRGPHTDLRAGTHPECSWFRQAESHSLLSNQSVQTLWNRDRKSHGAFTLAARKIIGIQINCSYTLTIRILWSLKYIVWLLVDNLCPINSKYSLTFCYPTISFWHLMLLARVQLTPQSPLSMVISPVVHEPPKSWCCGHHISTEIPRVTKQHAMLGH